MVVQSTSHLFFCFNARLNLNTHYSSFLFVLHFQRFHIFLLFFLKKLIARHCLFTGNRTIRIYTHIRMLRKAVSMCWFLNDMCEYTKSIRLKIKKNARERVIYINVRNIETDSSYCFLSCFLLEKINWQFNEYKMSSILFFFVFNSKWRLLFEI